MNFHAGCRFDCCSRLYISDWFVDQSNISVWTLFCCMKYPGIVNEQMSKQDDKILQLNCERNQGKLHEGKNEMQWDLKHCKRRQKLIYKADLFCQKIKLIHHSRTKHKTSNGTKIYTQFQPDHTVLHHPQVGSLCIHHIHHLNGYTLMMFCIWTFLCSSFLYIMHCVHQNHLDNPIFHCKDTPMEYNSSLDI